MIKIGKLLKKNMYNFNESSNLLVTCNYFCDTIVPLTL